MEKIDWAQKLTSRKLWVSVGVALGSISAGIAALGHPSEFVAGIGIGCGIISATIMAVAYQNAEGGIDRERIKSETKMTQTTIQASVVDKNTVEKMLVTSGNQEEG